MKRGFFFALFSAASVALMAAALVLSAFARPLFFHQLIFAEPLLSWNLIDKFNGKSNAEIVNRANMAVVTVIATRTVQPDKASPAEDWSYPPEKNVQRGTGAGFIIDAQGLIVTNEHVIKDADRIRVKLADGRERTAEVKGADQATDLALLKIEADGLSVLKLGDSEAVNVGDPVIAIGNPLEYDHSVTAGIVSAKGRKVYNNKPYEDFIQTDAAINRGNSGGPLLNQAGEVIGVNTVIRSDGRGISFAVPSNVVKTVASQLRGFGFVIRGFLGLTPANITPEFRDGLGLGNLQGIIVADVTPDRPAARAGIQPYDVITHFNGQTIKRTDDFFSLVANTLPQQKVELSVVRGGRPVKLFPILETRPDDRPFEAKPSLQKTGLTLGFTVRENTPEALRELRLGKLTEGVNGGVIVSDIDPLGPAADSSLTVGQLIVEANRQPINRLDDFQRVVSQLRHGSALVLRVASLQQKDKRLIAIRLGEL